MGLKESESRNFDKFLDCEWYLGEHFVALLEEKIPSEMKVDLRYKLLVHCLH